MTFKLQYTNSFKKDYKLIKRRAYNIGLLSQVLMELSQNGNLPSKYKPHPLKGNYKGYSECHIKPD